MIKKFCAYGFLKNLRFFEPFFILFFLNKGLNYTQIGLLITVREISVNLLEIPSGIWADYFSKKTAMMVCFASYIISFLTIHVSENIYMYFAAMFFFGIGEAFRSGTHKGIILDYLENKNILAKKLEVYSYTRSWSQKGSALSAVLSAGIVVFFNSYDNIFLFSIIPYIIALFLIATYPDYKMDKKNSKINAHLTDMYKHIKSKNLLKIIFNSALYESVFKSIKDYIQPFVMIIVSGIGLLSFSKEKNTAIVLGIFYFVIFLLSSYSSKISVKVAEKIKNNEIGGINISFILISILIILSGLCVLLPEKIRLFTLFILFLLLYILYNLRKPMMVSFYGEIVDKKHRAGVLSVDSQIKSFMLMIFSPFIGYIIDIYGISRGLIVFGIIVFLTIPFIWIREK